MQTETPDGSDQERQPGNRLLQEVDQEACRLARCLIRGSRDGALAVLRPKDGHPAASRILVASDFTGRPLVLMSSLSLHAQAIAADTRCSLLLGTPGKGDPLAHPRISVFAKALVVDPDDEDRVSLRERFLARHPKASLYIDFPDFRLVRLEPSSASLNGGFARAFELSSTDFVDPTCLELQTVARRAVDHMNADHLEAVDELARLEGLDAKGWRIVTLDRHGFEIMRGDKMRRIEFHQDAAEIGGWRQAFVTLFEKSNSVTR